MNKSSTSRNFQQPKEDGKNGASESIVNLITQQFNRINEKLEELKNSSIINTPSSDPDIITFLPVTTEADFQEFEDKLKNSPSEYQSLVAWYDQKILKEDSVKSSVNVIMLSTLKKNFAILYSGTGKRSKNGVKKNFSSTETFKCLYTVIKRKFPDCEREHSLAGQVGLWLARVNNQRSRKRSSKTKNA